MPRLALRPMHDCSRSCPSSLPQVQALSARHRFARFGGEASCAIVTCATRSGLIMQSRRSFFARVALVFGAIASGLAGRSRLRAEAPALGKGLSASLTYKTQLEKGLKARRPSDFTFISTVVTAVDHGTIPQKMVNETFDFARSKSAQYPFIYFQFALRKRAAKIGVSL